MSVPQQVNPRNNPQTLTRSMDEHVQYARLLIEKEFTALRPPNVEEPASSISTSAVGTVGIIGAGVGGLYAAMILQSLNIPYQILEASDHTGGRVFTYRDFKTNQHGAKDVKDNEKEREEDYFDVGAARFPKIDLMDRLFQLFYCKELNPPSSPGLASHLAPYIFTDPNTFLLFNRTRRRRSEIREPPDDAFNYSSENGGNVHPDFIDIGYQNIIREVMQGFVEALERDCKAGIRKLQRFDQYSVRGYMADCLKLPQPVIDWCETMDRSSGGYDLSLTQTVLNYLPFTHQDVAWYRLKGGAQLLPDYMEKYIREKAPAGTIQFKKIVTGISAKAGTVELKIMGEKAHRSFEHVISTIPMTCLQTLELDDSLQLSYIQRDAIRQLRYESAVKIGVKFRIAWWRDWETKEKKPLGIKGGHSYTDRCVRIVVYPSCDESTVLIASYCSSRDAHLLGGLIAEGDHSKERLKELVLRDLAAIHDVDVSKLEDEYQDLFGYNWGHAPFAQGAFAFFGPGQFSTIYTHFSHSAASGRLHFAGEALSVRHAWIVGTLDASWRAVLEILQGSPKFREDGIINKFLEEWGRNGEWDAPNSSDNLVTPRTS